MAMPAKRAAETPQLQRFMATIYKIWMLRYVDVPEEIGRALEHDYGKKKYIPVVAIVNSRSTRTTLTPAGAGRYRLQFNVTLRKAARADVGDVVGVELRLDRAPRELPVPPDLAAALRTRPKARAVFLKMGPGSRRQMLLYISRAKSPAVRRKYLARFLEILLERALLSSRRETPKRPIGGRTARVKDSR
jgi:Bacteriocin-protection, YdeI or OmpD-Associated/Domain of unknown function (DUF1905)